MKIARGNSWLVVTLTETETERFTGNPKNIAADGRLRALFKVGSDKKSGTLTFGKGYTFGSLGKSGDQRSNQDLTATGAKNLPVFGATPTEYKISTDIGEHDTVQLSFGMPAALRAFSKVKVIATGKAATRPAILTDNELRELKTRLNEALATGFKLIFSPDGSVEAFERRVA